MTRKKESLMVLESMVDGLKNDLARLENRISHGAFLPYFKKYDPKLWQIECDKHRDAALDRLTPYQRRLEEMK
jgi:hypothetical protein